ncbi:hypothetical protein [Antrihabitans stalactiti]|nr:hypothetical protein [Antrihabitans stalactiti]
MSILAALREFFSPHGFLAGQYPADRDVERVSTELAAMAAHR